MEPIAARSSNYWWWKASVMQVFYHREFRKMQFKLVKKFQELLRKFLKSAALKKGLRTFVWFLEFCFFSCLCAPLGKIWLQLLPATCCAAYNRSEISFIIFPGLTDSSVCPHTHVLQWSPTCSSYLLCSILHLSVPLIFFPYATHIALHLWWYRVCSKQK